MARRSGRLARGRTARALGPGVLAAAVFVLAACGGAGGGDPGPARSPSAAHSALCGSVPTLDRLVVRRSDAFPRNHMRFSFPAEVTVSDAAKVRAAARALCSLPKAPTGAIACPADFGIVYHLDFAARAHRFPPVKVDATGCQWVDGLGPRRWVVRSPGLWSTLGKAMGLSSPGYATFRGTGPSG